MRTWPPATVFLFPSALLAQTNDDIRDIAPPLPVFDPLKWIPWLLGAILLVAVVIYAYKRFYGRKKLSVRQRLPHEIAFDRLTAAKELMRPDACRDFSIQLSDTLRSYIEDRFSIIATRETSEEFLRRITLLEGSPLHANFASLQGFLAHCDEAKFANAAFETPVLNSLFQTAWAFVEKTGEISPSAETAPITWNSSR